MCVCVLCCACVRMWHVCARAACVRACACVCGEVVRGVCEEVRGERCVSEEVRGERCVGEVYRTYFTYLARIQNVFRCIQRVCKNTMYCECIPTVFRCIPTVFRDRK